MSTLQEQFQIKNEGRSLRFPESLGTPQSVLLEECGRHIDAGKFASNELLAQIGESVFQLEQIRKDYEQTENPGAHITDALEILQANLQETLENNDVTLTDLTNQELTADYRSQVEIRAQVKSPEATIRKVTFMEHPIVKRKNEVIAKGIVTTEIPELEPQE